MLNRTIAKFLFYGGEIRYCAAIPESPPLPPAAQEPTQ